MNIFVLDYDVENCARFHCDSHCVKMMVEYSQLMSTAHHVLDGDDSIYSEYLYKKTHQNHPCGIWVRESIDNYFWIYNLFIALSKEFYHRYGKAHLSWIKLHDILKTPPKNISKDKGLTEFALAMPDEYKTPDAVESYRAYYIGEKQKLLKWKNRPTPEWVLENAAI